VSGAVLRELRMMAVIMMPTKRTAAMMRNFFMVPEKSGAEEPRVA